MRCPRIAPATQLRRGPTHLPDAIRGTADAKAKDIAMFELLAIALYAIVCLAMIIQYFWITRPRPRNARVQSSNTEWYGLIEVSWVRDCQSNARNVLIAKHLFILFIGVNAGFLLYLMDTGKDSNLYTFGSRDTIMVPIIVASIVAIYQVLLGEIFFVHLIKKIQGTDMWILWILLLIFASVGPTLYESIHSTVSPANQSSPPTVSLSSGPQEQGPPSDTDQKPPSPRSDGSAPSSSQKVPGAPSDSTELKSLYQQLASSLGQIGFLAALAIAVAIMYILWIYHALFVQLSVNDGFSLPQFDKKIRVNILDSARRTRVPRVLIQSVIIGPKKSGKSELRRHLADPMRISDGRRPGTSATRGHSVRVNQHREQMPQHTAGNTTPNEESTGKLSPEPIANGPAATGSVPSTISATAGASGSPNRIGGPATAGTQQVEFGYRDIEVMSPFSSTRRRRTIQLCHYVLDCAGELLGDHIFLPVSVRADVLIVLIREKAFNTSDTRFTDNQYWTLRAIADLWDPCNQYGIASRDYFQGLYSATRSDERELSFRAQHQPKSVVVVLNVENDTEVELKKDKKALIERLKILSRDIGRAFNINSRDGRNCHATIINAGTADAQLVYEKVLNVKFNA